MSLTITFDLSDRDLSLLGDLINSKAKAVAAQEGEIISAARALLEKNEGAQVPDFIRQRMDRLAVLIRMLEDRVWELTGEDRERITNALAYFADPNDIIPDDVPGFGLLDDAVVIELVVQALRHDIEAYEDFCKFRESEELRRGKSVDPMQPEQWLRTRRLQLHERMRRRRDRMWTYRMGRRPPPSSVII
jgi:uncharacterized membrane protein YkvA (DUF1232 family)